VRKEVSLEEIVQKLHPGGQLLFAWKPTGGISAEITALEIGLPDGGKMKYIIRRHGEADLAGNPNRAALEFRLLQFLQEGGILAPKPCLLDNSCEILSTPYLVVEYIQGASEFTPTDLSDYLGQFTTQLVNIHHLNLSRWDFSTLPRQTLRFYNSLESPDKNTTPGLELERIRPTLTQAWSSMQSNTPVLLHGDYWPGNILWDDGRLAAVIDWEDARLGEPLADLSNSRLEILWAFGSDTLQDFTQRYQAMMEIDYTNLPYWDLWAVLKPAAKLRSWGLEPEKQKEMLRALSWFAQQAYTGIRSE